MTHELIERVLAGENASSVVGSQVIEAGEESPVNLDNEFPESSLDNSWHSTEGNPETEISYDRYHPDWRSIKGSNAEDRRVVMQFQVFAYDINYSDDGDLDSVGGYSVQIAQAAELGNLGLPTQKATNKAGDQMLVHKKKYNAAEFKRSLSSLKSVFKKMKAVQNSAISKQVKR